MVGKLYLSRSLVKEVFCPPYGYEIGKLKIAPLAFG